MPWHDGKVLTRIGESGAVPQGEVQRLYENLTKRQAQWLYWTEQSGGETLTVALYPEESQPGLQVVPLLDPDVREAPMQSSRGAAAKARLVDILAQLKSDFSSEHLWSNIRVPAADLWPGVLAQAGFVCRSTRFLWSVERADLRPSTPVGVDLRLDQVSNDAVLDLLDLNLAVAAIHADTQDPLDALRLVEPEGYLAQLVALEDDVDALLWVLAWDGDVLVGYACLARDGASLWIFDIGVVPSARGQGAGCALLLRAVALADAQAGRSWSQLEALIDEGNIASRDFHRRMGFSKGDGGESMWHLTSSL